MTDKFNDPKLNEYQKEFEQAVGRRQWNMIGKRLLPRVVPPVVTTAAFSASVLLNVWEMLPPQARLAGVIGYGLALAASPFINRKAGSPIVSKRDAIQEIDRGIGDYHDTPAATFNNAYTGKSDTGQRALWEAHKKRHWEKWRDQIQGQETESAFQSYYKDNRYRQLSHAAVLLATVFGAAVNGTNFSDNLQTALDWTVPPPPLAYNATITPPDDIEGVRVFTDLMIKTAIENGVALSPHEQSVLTFTTYDRPTELLIDGEPPAPVEGSDRGQTIFTYETVLTPDTVTIQFEDVTINLNIEEDQGPSIEILSTEANPRFPESVELRYNLGDDFGTTSAEAEMGFTTEGEGGEFSEPVLEINRLPTIVVPHR